MMGLLITAAILVAVVKLASADKTELWEKLKSGSHDKLNPWAGLKSELFDKPKPPRNNKNYPPPATY